VPEIFDEDRLERELRSAESPRRSLSAPLKSFVTFLGSSVFWGAVFAAILYLTQHAYEDRLARIQNQYLLNPV